MKRSNIKDILLRVLCLPAIERLLAAFIPQAWLASFISKHLYKQVAVPLINAAIVEIEYKIDVVDGEKILTKIEEAQNETAHNDAIDSLFD